MMRFWLTAVIGAYRALPGAWRHTCPRVGASCSALGWAAARSGAGLAGVRAITGACVGDEGCSRTWD